MHIDIDRIVSLAAASECDLRYNSMFNFVCFIFTINNSLHYDVINSISNLSSFSRLITPSGIVNEIILVFCISCLITALTD